MKALVGHYLLRDDGKLLYEGDDGTETPVLDANTGLPLTDVTDVQEGGLHGCAVLGTTQAAWCWRTAEDGNASGQLGNGTMDATGPVFRATRVLTGVDQPLANVVAIAGSERQRDGAQNGCAVTGDGRLYCWGYLNWIINGGDTAYSAYAVPITTDGVTPLSGVRQAAFSGGDACAIVQNGCSKELWCWGQNLTGVLGLGDALVRRYPTKVSGVLDPIKVVMESLTVCALDGVGVRCWGHNLYGSTGNGTTASPVLTPATVVDVGGSALGGIVDLHSGEEEDLGAFCALTTSSTLQCWGLTFAAYATAFGPANVFALGGIEGGQDSVRYVTGDGLYHRGATTSAPNCGPLQ